MNPGYDKESFYIDCLEMKIARMDISIGILLAAMGITTLELAEAAAVGLALYADSGKHIAFLYVAAGTVSVLIPTLLLGRLVAYLPQIYVELIGGILLLYFGLRLVRSARRSVVKGRTTGFQHQEEFEKGVMATGFSVGAVEAFEAAIVLVGLLPNNYVSSEIGIAAGVIAVVVATYFLRKQVRKVKQAIMKVLVSALLLTFSAFWFGEIFLPLKDLYLIPIFVIFVILVYAVANRQVPARIVQDESPAKKEEEHKSNPIHDKDSGVAV